MKRLIGILVAGILVVVLSAAAFAPGLGGGFLNWDDNRFVDDNPIVQGFSVEHVRAIFARPHHEAYHPLHLLSYVIDYELYGKWAPGYRIHNLVLYLVSLLLLYQLLRRLELSETAALAGVLLFAVHPLHVEAVAWVSGRKEPLSLCFMLAAALLHLDASAGGRWRDWRRWIAVLLFGCALLTKTSTVVLPVLLVAVEVLARRRRLMIALAGVAPMLLLALAVGLYVIGLWQENAMTRPRPESPGGVVALVLGAHGHYLKQLVVPVELSPVYAINRRGAFGFEALLGLLGVVAGAFLLWRVKDGRARLAVVWWLVALLPVLNIVPVYFYVQDRYAFIASAALAIGVAAAVERFASRRASLAAVTVVAGILAVLTAMQARHWRSSAALWERAVKMQPGSYYAQLARGHTLRTAGDPAAALSAYRRAIALQPGLPAAEIAACLADSDLRTGSGERARQIEKELAQLWQSAQGLRRLSAGLLQRGELVCAALAETRAFALREPAAVERIAAASRWTLAGAGSGAARHLRQVRVTDLPDPLRAAYHEVMAQALFLEGRRGAAAAELQRSLDISPRKAGALLEAAEKLRRFGRDDLAGFYRHWAERAVERRAE